MSESLNKYSVKGSYMPNGKRVAFSAILYARDFDHLMQLVQMSFPEAEVTEVHMMEAGAK